MAIKRRSLVNSVPSSRCYDDYVDYELYVVQDKNINCCQKHRCGFITLTVLLLLLILAFIIIFVVPPITFMLSTNVQRHLIFLTSYGNEYRDFTNFKKYGIEGVRNLYVPIQPNITLGVWHILPLEYTYDAVINDNYSYETILRNGHYPILMYFHDSGENRITSKNKYLILRRFFHIIAFDYRCFGDSSVSDLSEHELTYDSVLLYKWLRTQTQADVYMWGHGLGSSVACRTIFQLRKESIVPKGLFLESPFANLSDEFTVNPYLKIFEWTPWFKATFLDSITENGFLFKTNEYILSVDCPVMIIHAEDNYLVPYTQSKKLVQISDEMRDNSLQGNVTFHLLAKQFRYGHNDLYLADQLPDYIQNHIKVCMMYNKGKG